MSANFHLALSLAQKCGEVPRLITREKNNIFTKVSTHCFRKEKLEQKMTKRGESDSLEDFRARFFLMQLRVSGGFKC